MINLYLSNSPFQFTGEAYAYLVEVLAGFEQTFIEYDPEPAEKMVRLERNLVLQLQKLLDSEEQSFVSKDMLEQAILNIADSYKNVDKETPRSNPKASTNSYHKAVTRDEEQAIFGGVCAGLANYLGLSVALVRGLVIGLSFLFFFPVFLYLFLWLILPKETSPTQQVFNATHAKDIKNKVSNFFVANKQIFIRGLALLLMIPLIIATVSLIVATLIFVFSDSLNLTIHSDQTFPYAIELLLNQSKWDIAILLVLIVGILLYISRLSLVLYQQERLVWNKTFLWILGILFVVGASKITFFKSGMGLIYDQAENYHQESQTIGLHPSYRDLFLFLEKNVNKRRTIPFSEAGDYIYVKIKRKPSLDNIQIRLKVMSLGDDTRLNYPIRIVNNQVYLPDFLMGKRRGRWIEKKVELQIGLPTKTRVQIENQLRSNSRFIFIRE